MKTYKEYHDKIVDLIFKYGIKYPKKHGNYIKLPFYKDSFFEMDSWNKSIHLKVGSGEQERSEGLYDWYYHELKGEDLFWLGSNWGRFEKGNASEEQMQYWYNEICSLILKGYYNG